jgi:hypothetical protein
MVFLECLDLAKIVSMPLVMFFIATEWTEQTDSDRYTQLRMNE